MSFEQGDRHIDVVLVGGPADLPAEHRRRRVTMAERKVKVVHRGGYEHFEPAEDGAECGEHAARPDSRPRVFRWTSRTKIAE